MTKTIENKTTVLKLDETHVAKYTDLLFIIMNRPVPNGIKTSEMRRDMRILEAIEKGKDADTIEFTHDDIKFLAELAENHEWPNGHIQLVEFTDAVAALV